MKTQIVENMEKLFPYENFKKYTLLELMCIVPYKLLLFEPQTEQQKQIKQEIINLFKIHDKEYCTDENIF